MSDLHRAVCAISATIFSAIVLISIIVLGNPVARNIAIAAAFMGVISQFLAQDQNARLAHLIASYMGLVIALAALIAFITQG